MKFLKTVTIITLIFSFTGCFDSFQMAKPILTNEVEVSAFRSVVIDDKKYDVYDTSEQAMANDLGKFLNEDVPEFFEHYCIGTITSGDLGVPAQKEIESLVNGEESDKWELRPTGVFEGWEVVQKGKVGMFDRLERIVLFSDNQERYNAIGLLKENGLTERVDSFERLHNSKGFLDWKTRTWMRWKIMTKDFFEYVPDDFRNDEKYPSFTEGFWPDGTLATPPFTMKEDGMLVNTGKVSNIFMLAITYHPYVDRESEECMAFKGKYVFDSAAEAWRSDLADYFEDEPKKWLAENCGKTGQGWPTPSKPFRFSNKQAMLDFAEMVSQLPGGSMQNLWREVPKGEYRWIQHEHKEIVDETLGNHFSINFTYNEVYGRKHECE